MHRFRHAVEDAGLDRTWLLRLLRGQPQQAQQPGVLCPEPSDLLAQRRQFVVQADQRQGALIRGLGGIRHDSVLSPERDPPAALAATACRQQGSDRLLAVAKTPSP